MLIAVGMTASLFLFSCKSEPGATVTADPEIPEDYDDGDPMEDDAGEASDEADTAGDASASYSLKTPFSTLELPPGRTLDAEELAEAVETPAPGASYYFRGSLPTHWASDMSVELVAENIGNRTTIYAVAFSEAGGRKHLYTLPIHQEEGGKVVLRSVFGGDFAEILCRYDFRGKPRVEILSPYTYDDDFTPQAVLPMLDKESGQVNNKDAIVAIMRRLQMSGDWKLLGTESGSFGQTIWVTDPCGGGSWLTMMLEEGEGYETLAEYPVISFSDQDTYEWTVNAISWSDFGNEVKLSTSSRNSFLEDADNKVYEYRLVPAAGARVFNEVYAVTSQVENVLSKSTEDCPEEEY